MLLNIKDKSKAHIVVGLLKALSGIQEKGTSILLHGV